jgi:hypothetical protein
MSLEATTQQHSSPRDEGERERERERENRNAKVKTCNRKQTAENLKYKTTTETKENTIEEVEAME